MEQWLLCIIPDYFDGKGRYSVLIQILFWWKHDSFCHNPDSLSGYLIQYDVIQSPILMEKWFIPNRFRLLFLLLKWYVLHYSRFRGGETCMDLFCYNQTPFLGKKLDSVEDQLFIPKMRQYF